jgi:hypothetical protein
MSPTSSKTGCDLDLTAAVAAPAAETASAPSMMIQTHQLLRISTCTY